ncbi:MAG: L-glutamate gamma-semialdehyde dehydrogenase [Bacteroidales bacterium]|nr:L-glutamate gamma-semialdehyde dehydrogenase [Bacteroidales bacterium]
MNNAIFRIKHPVNEPIKDYKAGSSERKELLEAVKELKSKITEIPIIIGGKDIFTGNTGNVVMPHNHRHILAKYHNASEKEVQLAIEAALEAHKYWESISWIERVSINLKIADLIAGKYRNLLNAATMLGQGKNVFQAEIDAACETVDFLRFNAHYVSEIYNDQPPSDFGAVNRLEYRPLEGFVFAVSPFNFTAIASNLSMAPVLMGNTVVWKPATTSLLSNYLLMKIYKEAGLPDGVINFVPGKGSVIGKTVFSHKDFAGVHFTGSTPTFNHFWKTIAENLSFYKSYPRIVGETGGKDFVFMHNSAEPIEVATALVRGSFEYQGQKCSAASRAYIPESKWEEVKEHIIRMVSQIDVGDPEFFPNFMNAVIDEAAFNNIMSYISKAKESKEATFVYGGEGDKTNGYFIQPTIIKTDNPHFITMEEEIFGPVLTIYVYPDNEFEKTLETCDNTSPYALTGSVFARDRQALTFACKKLKYAAGNFYYNDKPSGAMVGQQPFGGARGSGTNEKTGSHLNLMRWTNPRTIKETLVPPTDFKYPFMNEGSCK